MTCSNFYEHMAAQVEHELANSGLDATYEASMSVLQYPVYAVLCEADRRIISNLVLARARTRKAWQASLEALAG